MGMMLRHVKCWRKPSLQGSRAHLSLKAALIYYWLMTPGRSYSFLSLSFLVCKLKGLFK